MLQFGVCCEAIFIKILTVVVFSKRVKQICNYQRIQTKINYNAENLEFLV